MYRPAPTKANTGPETVRIHFDAAGAGPLACKASPMSTARIIDWSSHPVERRWRMGASRRMRWMHTALGAA